MTGSIPNPLLSVFEHDPDMGEIVALFVSEMPERANELRGAIESGNLDRAATIAHQLKGAAGGYGFEELGDIAAAAEQALKALASTDAGSSPNAIRAATASLVEACGRVRLSSSQHAA